MILPAIPSGYALSAYMAGRVSGDGKDNDDAAQKFIYPVWFGNRPEETLMKGTQHGLHRLDGTHKLVITFASAPSAAVVVDVVGRQWANLSADASGILRKSIVVG